MGKELEQVKRKGLTRRAFISASAGAAALTAIGLGGCAPAAPQQNALAKAKVDVEEGATWVTAACWHNCGGRCLNKVLVKDGLVLRQKTDDTHEDSPDFPQQRACQRGRSQRMQVFGADRLKYPMKRKGWSPDKPNGQLRGEDEWERISWDEAFKLVADEIKKIYADYGPESVFALGGSEVQRALLLMGGYIPRWGSVSWGAWPQTYNLVAGAPGYTYDAPDRLTMRKHKLIILWGCNPANSSAGLPTYNYLQVKKAGCRFVVIDPRYNETAETLEADWIPIRPATDTAMALGMMHHLVSNNLHDQEYLDTYTVGFDRDHMPTGDYPEFTYKSSDRKELKYQAGAPSPDENFKDYLLGQGIYAAEGPKTAEWAEKICGVPAATIKKLAEDYVAAKPASIIAAGAPARINSGECLPHALLTLGMVAGQLGRDGGSVSATMHNSASNGGDGLVSSGGAGLKVELPKNPYPANQFAINQGEMWEAVLDGSYTQYKGEKKEVDIQMIYEGSAGCLNQRVGMTKGIEAYKKVEFTMALNYVLNTSAKYSDVVLPVTTQWERPGTLLDGNREILIFGQKVCDPLFEAKSDQQIAEGIAEALGFKASDIYDLDETQQLFNKLAGSTYVDTDGQPKPLLTITAADIAEMGVVGEAQQGRISLQEFKEKGLFQIERTEGDAYTYLPFKDFIADPVANPVKTPSGKFEIYCGILAAYIERNGFTTKDPLPKYPHILEGYEDGQADGYPFQLITHHYQRRSHHTFDNVEWLREAWPQELWINESDAASAGINEGDLVRLSSRWGTVARPAFVTKRIAPGVVSLGEGAWAQLNKDGVDEAGATNTLCGPHATGQGHSGYNSCNCRLEKYRGTILPDAQWPQRIPLA
ncbi:MAG: molybdopterin-dependent oxidoreductase [Coriobacteriaceae bacterium]|nr:molybdopterin-dependent oxidoreductase [Coriobacteriaceae bacterium]